MSFLLEILGRGMLTDLHAALGHVMAGASTCPASAGAGSADDHSRRSVGELEALVRDDPTNFQVRCALAVRLFHEKNIHAARAHFLEAAELAPSDRAARIGLACALDALGALPAAVEQLELTLSYGHDDGIIWFSLGFCQEKLARWRDAARAYQQAIKRAPQLRNIRERLAAICLKSGDVDGAVRHYEHICFSAPADLAANLSLAHLYLHAGRVVDAERRFEYVIALEPDNWEVEDELISSLTAQQQFEDAAAALHQRLAVQPDDADARLKLGDVYSSLARHSAARPEYARAVALNPECLEAAVKFAIAILRAADFSPLELALAAHQEAAYAFARAIEINERIVSAFVGLCAAQLARGRNDDAFETLEMAGEIEPNTGLLFAEAARLHLQLADRATSADGNGSRERRIRMIFESTPITSAPEDMPAWLRPGRRESCPARAGGYHSAPGFCADPQVLLKRQIASLRAVAERGPGSADAHFALGLMLRHTGQLQAAVESFRRAVCIYPVHAKARNALVFALREAGRIDEAVGILREKPACDLRTMELHYQLALLYTDRCDPAAVRPPNGTPASLSACPAASDDDADRPAHPVQPEPEPMWPVHAESGEPSELGNEDLANVSLALQTMGVVDRADACWRTLQEAASLDSVLQSDRRF